MKFGKQKDTQARSGCIGCGQSFNSTVQFDNHRIGAQGADRRCMTVDEMQAAGWECIDGHWRIPLSDEQRASMDKWLAKNRSAA